MSFVNETEYRITPAVFFKSSFSISNPEEPGVFYRTHIDLPCERSLSLFDRQIAKVPAVSGVTGVNRRV